MVLSISNRMSKPFLPNLRSRYRTTGIVAVKEQIEDNFLLEP